MPKLYFITNTPSTELPPEFVNATTKRFIHVINIKLISATTGGLILNTSAHGDFITNRPYRNDFLCFSNEQLDKRKKWEITHTIHSIRLHFENFDGITIDPATYKFTAELMLEW